jgi:RNA polymerase sigma-70 factor (ECF subfamily)
MDVAVMVKHLPENERIVVLLFYLEEVPIKEIVKITGMPEGTIKSHLSRARSHLASILGSR